MTRPRPPLPTDDPRKPRPEKKFPATVRTTMHPDEDLEVDAREYAELEAQGLLVGVEKRERGQPARPFKRPKTTTRKD